MRAPSRPGDAQDVFNGACPSCFYCDHGKTCEHKSGPNLQRDTASVIPMNTSNDPPPNGSRKSNPRQAAQEVSAAPHPEEGVRAKSVSVDGQDTQDPKHRLQDQAFKFACRVRTLPPEERQDVPERIETLLKMQTIELDALDMVRCVLEQPREERVQSTEMILQILRAMLV